MFAPFLFTPIRHPVGVTLAFLVSASIFLISATFKKKSYPCYLALKIRPFLTSSTLILPSAGKEERKSWLESEGPHGREAEGAREQEQRDSIPPWSHWMEKRRRNWLPGCGLHPCWSLSVCHQGSRTTQRLDLIYHFLKGLVIREWQVLG